MAQTIIVSPTSEPVNLPQAGGTSARWRCLARRGMVFSELEGFDHTAVGPGNRFRVPSHPYSELVVLVAAGRGDVLLGVTRERAVWPGDVVLQPPGGGCTIINSGTEELELISVEVVPPRYADLLPYRTPMIVELPEAVQG